MDELRQMMMMEVQIGLGSKDTVKVGGEEVQARREAAVELLMRKCCANMPLQKIPLQKMTMTATYNHIDLVESIYDCAYVHMCYAGQSCSSEARVRLTSPKSKSSKGSSASSDAVNGQMLAAGMTNSGTSGGEEDGDGSGAGGRKMSHIDMGMPHKDSRKTSQFGFQNPLQGGGGGGGMGAITEDDGEQEEEEEEGKKAPVVKSPSHSNNLIEKRRMSRGGTPSK